MLDPLVSYLKPPLRSITLAAAATAGLMANPSTAEADNIGRPIAVAPRAQISIDELQELVKVQIELFKTAEKTMIGTQHKKIIKGEDNGDGTFQAGLLMHVPRGDLDQELTKEIEFREKVLEAIEEGQLSDENLAQYSSLVKEIRSHRTEVIAAVNEWLEEPASTDLSLMQAYAAEITIGYDLDPSSQSLSPSDRAKFERYASLLKSVAAIKAQIGRFAEDELNELTELIPEILLMSGDAIITDGDLDSKKMTTLIERFAEIAERPTKPEEPPLAEDKIAPGLLGPVDDAKPTI